MSKINAVKNEMVLGMGNKTFCFKSTYTISIAGPGLYLNQFWWRAVNQFFFVQQRREYQQNYSCLIMGPSLLKCKLKAQCILKSVLGGTVYFKICAGRHSVFYNLCWAAQCILKSVLGGTVYFEICAGRQCILKFVLGSTVYFKICAGRHSVFCSECWEKIVSPGQACPAPPTVATTVCFSHRPFSKPRLRLWIRLQAPFSRLKPWVHICKTRSIVEMTAGSS